MGGALSGHPPALARAVLLIATPCLVIATLMNRMLRAGMPGPYSYTALRHDPLRALEGSSHDLFKIAR